MSVHLFSISGLTRSLEVAYEARAASGEPGKTEDCGWRGSCEGIFLYSYSSTSYSSCPFKPWQKKCYIVSKRKRNWRVSYSKHRNLRSLSIILSFMSVIQCNASVRDSLRKTWAKLYIGGARKQASRQDSS